MLSNNVMLSKIIGVLFFIFLLINSSLLAPIIHSSPLMIESSKAIAGFSSTLTIGAGEEYVLKYNPSSDSFTKVTNPLTDPLSEKVNHAISKAPNWLEESLIYQFTKIDNADTYADLIITAKKELTDEIAFCIAHGPLGNPPDPDLILSNVEQIYKVDDFISYADIIEINQKFPDYYSTIQYTVLEGNNCETRLLPREIYYWYIVHPQILSENPEFIYDSFWRDYLFYHNDLGYPLLLEKIENIEYLWDNQSYAQPGNRDWQESIQLHPTAVEAVSYWVGKTVPYQATGDRPGQPNLIAHQHNGWCGELQRIAVAGLRSVLVPSISVCNIAEDHVWREFYDTGWHQNDNWWTDSGGTVDVPNIYSEGWGKDMSSVFSWRGDGMVSDVTSRYIRAEDTVNVSFLVSDLRGKPVDGARITVLVKGLKDITWYKNKAIDLLDSFWDKVPSLIKDSFFGSVYDRLIYRIENISDVIDGLTISIWNYTDADGVSSFTLGRYDEYVFFIQQPIDSLPFPLASWTSLRTLKNPVDTAYSIRFPTLLSERVPSELIHSDITNEGEMNISLSLESEGIQYQANVKNNDIGQFQSKSPISFMVLNEEEYIKYDNNKDFKSYFYKKDYTIFDNLILNEDIYYFVFYNPTQHIKSSANISLTIDKITNEESVIILKPSTTTCDHPLFQSGETIEIRGISSDETTIQINNEQFLRSSGGWTILVNTSHWNPGDYVIKATCGSMKREVPITLFDNTPPSTHRINVKPYEIIPAQEELMISGKSADNHDVKNVSIRIDDEPWALCEGKNDWMKTIDTSRFTPGIHTLDIKTVDNSNNQDIINQPIIFNTTIPTSNLTIQSIEWSPQYPTNQTMITIYANVTSDHSFPVKKVLLDYQTTERTDSTQFYEYAQHPKQERHVEDPKLNQSNNALYGVELGSFSAGEIIYIRITAYDVALNKQQSEWIPLPID